MDITVIIYFCFNSLEEYPVILCSTFLFSSLDIVLVDRYLLVVRFACFIRQTSWRCSRIRHCSIVTYSISPSIVVDMAFKRNVWLQRFSVYNKH